MKKLLMSGTRAVSIGEAYRSGRPNVRSRKVYALALPKPRAHQQLVNNWSGGPRSPVEEVPTNGYPRHACCSLIRKLRPFPMQLASTVAGAGLRLLQHSLRSAQPPRGIDLATRFSIGLGIAATRATRIAPICQ